MEDGDNNQIGNRIFKVPAIEIIGKLKTKTDRQNFCRESNSTFINSFIF